MKKNTHHSVITIEKIRQKALSRVRPVWNKGLKTGLPSWNRGKPGTMLGKKCSLNCKCKKHFPRPEVNLKKSLAMAGRPGVSRPAWNKGKTAATDSRCAVGICLPECTCFRHTSERNEKRYETNLLKYGRAGGPVEDTDIEMKVAVLIRERGIEVVEFKLDVKFVDGVCYKQVPMYGTVVDFYFPDKKLVLFADGCYWHGHQCDYNPYWKRDKKLSEQQVVRQQKDRTCDSNLINSSHKVIRIWGCDLMYPRVDAASITVTVQ